MEKLVGLKSITILLIIIFSIQASGQITLDDWSEAENFILDSYTSFDISLEAFDSQLKLKTQRITIPTPDGKFEQFEIHQVQVVAPEVAHLYTIKTFTGHKVGDPRTLIACDLSAGGFHAAVYSKDHSYFIEPITAKTPEKLKVFFKKEMVSEKLNCSVASHKHEYREPLIKSVNGPDTKELSD